MANEFKIRFKQRCHSPVYIKEPFLQGPIIVRKPDHPETTVLGEGHRKYIQPRFSEEQQFRAAKRPIAHRNYSDEVVLRGKKYVPQPDKGRGELSHAERVHFDESKFASEEFGRLPCSTWTRKRVVKTANGVALGRKESDDWGVETAMNRKQRVGSSQHQRNQIPEASKGDKYYKEADREPGFYEKGGIIVGSTNTLRQSAKPTLRKKDDVLNASTGKKLEATYGKLQAKLAKEYDKNQVSTLTLPSKDFQGQDVPSWEAKTGNFLIDPDEESVY